jgi:hypothetical protein
MMKHVEMKPVPPEAMKMLEEKSKKEKFQPIGIVFGCEEQIYRISKRGVPFQSYTYFEGKKWVIVTHVGDSPGCGRTLQTALHRAVKHWNKANKPRALKVVKAKKSKSKAKAKAKAKRGGGAKKQLALDDPKHPRNVLAEAERLLDIR